MTPAEFKALARQLATLNQVDQDTAEDWLVLIGDTPEFQQDGSVLIPDGSGRTIIWPPEDF